MKIGLLISGYLRSFEHNIENIKKYIIENNDVDIYIYITKNIETKYLNFDIDINKIINLLNPKYIIISDNIDFKKENNINDVMNQNLKFYLLNEERKRIEKIEKISYDLVCKIRPDVYLNEPIYFYKFDMNRINIPLDSKIDKIKLKNIEDNYICDIIAFGNCNQMNKYFDYYLQLDFLIQKYGTVNETLLYHYLNDNNILYDLINIDYLVILSLFNTIAITGDSGSGKTILTKILKKIFDNSFILECDRYHKWERDDINWKNYTHLNPEANFITKMQNDVFDLKIGNNIYQIDYDHKTGQFTDKELIESKENIIVCGLHSLYMSDNILNLKIYMDTDDNLRIPWKIKRDVQNRGYSIEKIFTQIKSRDDDFQKYIYPQKEKADVIINLYTDKVFELNNYDINETLNVYLRIGVKSSYNINKIVSELSGIKQIKNEEKYIYFYFNEMNYNEEYKSIIKTMIFNII
jgi:uridine kinase